MGAPLFNGVGLFSCLTALAIQLFPNAAFSIGIDMDAVWLLFGFGVFLIIMAALMARGTRELPHCGSKK